MIAFDCHAHVYEDTSAMPGARYCPKAPAPASDWLKNQEEHGLRGGVIVQVSFLGSDNSQLTSALAKLDRKRFCGVGVVPMGVDDDTLDSLVEAGIRGVRWNLVRGADTPDLATPLAQKFIEKLRKRNLHLEVHLEGPRLAQLLGPLSSQGIAIVVDHFGLPSEPSPRSDPMINAVFGLSDLSNLFFKFSGDYRSAFDLTPHAQALLAKLPPDHVVWGSDWPHTQHEDKTTYNATYRSIEKWRLQADETAARALYGIGVD